MAEALELAKAYVQIVPTTKNIGANMDAIFSGSEVDQASKKAGSGIGAKLADGIKGTAKIIAGAAVSAVSAGVAGITALTKEAVGAYKEFEQLNGGAELMWGEAYDFIRLKAMNAYKDVQMSANQYLESANYYATGLKTALGGNAEAAAQLADDIIKAQADIISATGASSEAVSNAFNGVMRGNYTMLDNLGLGIAGTKEGMQSVIDAVNKWKISHGEAGDLVIENLADCEEALVKYVEMQGMADYASKEGMTTIEGSVNSLKAAWDNLLVGMADGQYIPRLVGDLVDSVLAVVSNVSPIIEQALPNIISGLTLLITALLPEIPPLLQGLLPAVFDGAMSLAGNLIELLPEVIKLFLDNFPFGQLMELIPMIVDAFIQMLPVIGEAGKQIAMTLVNYAVEGLPIWIPKLAQMIVDFARKLTDSESIGKVIDVAFTLLNALADGIIEALPILLDNAPEMIYRFLSAITENLPKLLEMGGQLIIKLVSGLVAALPKLVSEAPKLIAEFVKAIALSFMQLVEAGGNLVVGLWQGIRDKGQWFKDLISGWVGDVIGFIKRLFGIRSPSTKMAFIGEMLDRGLAIGIEDNMAPIDAAIDDIVDETTGKLDADLGVNAKLGVSTSAEATGQLGQLINIVMALTEKVDHLQIVLDGDKVVGGIRNRMDAAIGENGEYSQRGVAAVC